MKNPNHNQSINEALADLRLQKHPNILASIYVLPSQLSQHLVTHVVEPELAKQTVQSAFPPRRHPVGVEQELEKLLIKPTYAYI